MQKLKFATFLLGLAIMLQPLLWTGFSPAPTHPAQAQEAATGLIISAVQITGGPGFTQEDFVELYNSSSEPVDLNGFRLVKRTATGVTDQIIKSWSETTIVAPYHFYLWANSSFSDIAVAPDVTTAATLADNNGIALRLGANDTGVLHDSVAWGSSANGFEVASEENPGADVSLARLDLFSIDAGFELRPSAPRNTAVELLPESPPQQPEPPAPEPEPPEEAPPVQTLPDDPSPEPELTPEPEPPSAILQITELFPNPSGEDAGQEKIELFNAGQNSVDLAGYVLDDVAAQDPLSSNAYTLPSATLGPGQYLAITIPAGKFALNNTVGDIVTLFNSELEAVASAHYEGTAPESKSFSYFASGWQWANSTFGAANGSPPAQTEQDSEDQETAEDESDYDNSGLVINEIYADPTPGQSEFVEIFNSGEGLAQLSQAQIWVGEKKKVLPEQELAPGKYYVVESKNLPAQLRNSGQSVKLVSVDGDALSTVTYPTSTKGQSFARFEDGFLWTTEVTKALANVLKIPEQLKKQSLEQAKKTTAVKASAKPVAKAKSTATKPTTKSATAKPSAAAPQAKASQVPESGQLAAAQPPTKPPLGKIIAMGAAAAAAGVFALYKLVFTAGLE
jgi:hypothetical protein